MSAPAEPQRWLDAEQEARAQGLRVADPERLAALAAMDLRVED